mgnify:CR=1 FL=1
MSGTNSVYMEEMYRLWKSDPSKVHSSWDTYFRNVDAGLGPGQAFIAPPSLQPGVKPVASSGAAASGDGGASYDKIRIMHLVRAFQVRGHELAKLDPLRISGQEEVPDLDYRQYGFTEADLEKSFDTTGFAQLSGFMGVDETATLKQLLEKLQSTYCGPIGWQYMHIMSRDKCNWLRERIELSEPHVYSADTKKQILDRLAFSDQFERFLAHKFNTAKRFGLEGCETLIPGIKALIDTSTKHGVENVVLGMPHRGRLNVLTNVVRKPAAVLFKEFAGENINMEEYVETLASGGWHWTGDVKYHLGTSYEREYEDGRKVHLSLVANPSHLETVNPVVAGKARAKQDLDGDVDGAKTMPVLMHGDAAFAGQGVVYETLQMAKLEGFKTGGTIHVIANNQIGFTTDSVDARSTRYCSDLGKAFDLPIFHVNADDPEAVQRVFEIAADYRAEFKEDVIIDLIGYRKYGHNEMDQPRFTQPIMYSAVEQQAPALDQYIEKLVGEGVVSKEEADAVVKNVNSVLEDGYEASKTYESKSTDWLATRWKGFFRPNQQSKVRYTGLPREELDTIGKGLVAIPDDIEMHANVKRIFQQKAKSLQDGKGIDWGTAEALAFGSLLREGKNVRLTGQDVNRGTFSHRHGRVFDQKTNKGFAPLNHLSEVDGKEQGKLHLFNSHLSEYGVLGFETGYSLEDPHNLVLWEAQFGDFVNGAQIIIDQYITSGEAKWMRQCGVTMLLPHGYDGQGPEHSSCRMERFLQAVDTDEDTVPNMAEDARMQIQHANMQVVNITTPANYFHVLRRQMHRDFRKPLIVVAPKALLRLKKCASDLEDFQEGTKFRRFIADDSPVSPSCATAAPEKVRKLLLCSGKVYYDLEKARGDKGVDDVAIARVEQLAPFPFDLVAKECAKYPNAEVVWVQEEPRNMGAWAFVQPRIEAATLELNSLERRPLYVGRRPAAAPATGLSQVHTLEQKDLLDQAFA